MQKLTYAFFIFVVIFTCSSCSNKQYQVLFQQKKALSADTGAAKKAVAVEVYRIQPQDLLQIRNLQDTKFITNLTPVSSNTSGGNASQGEVFQVAADSAVDLPAIGKTKVVGLTRVDAQKLIQDLYAKVLLVNPIIELKIINLKVTILGEIKGQANYPLVKDKTTLVELIGEAGGLTDRANEKDIKIIRGSEQNPKVIHVDLSDIRTISDPQSLLQSGDIVYVSENRRAARNENLQNFSVILQPALILFNTALIIFTLVKK
ncbi:MAG TPA: polysaccharide biosynthesis/export family protein [Mucilaginibacter sp.]|jgi:polysaccharide export outer membrane protein|nr:polysaccharide biosynthesis/export family protein [Mucilaginibacter sp.]